MKYDAFISYRHAPLDMEIAKKLHKALETFHIPASVRKKTGKKKINRVFRDQEELPIGSDLNDNISAALKESGYLIVICSPETPGSYWVLKEIESFIELHDREHVLAILIDGEPGESFPAPLLTDENGNPVEPLAADIRGKTAKERDKKFKTEFLRLAAPLIGCTYDDLKQRHKERIIKRNIAIGASVLGAVAAFGIFFGTYNAFTAAKMKRLAEEKAALADEKTRLAGEIYQELRSKQINQSKFYSEKSLSLLEEGRREDAVLVAMEGLPGEEDDRPLVSEAEYALSRALYTYGSDTNYQLDRELRTDYIINDLYLNDTETRAIATTGSATVYVWDTDTWEELIKLDPTDLGDNIYIINGISADENYIYIATPGTFLFMDYNGNLVKDIPFDETIQQAEINIKTMTAAVIGQNKVYEFDLKNAEILHEFINPFETKYGYVAEYYPEQNLITVNHNSEAGDGYVSLINTESGEIKKLPAKGNTISEIIYTSSGKISFLSRKNDHIFGEIKDDCINTYSTDGTFLWRTALDSYYQPTYVRYDFLSSHTIETENGEVSRIFLSLQYKSYTLDEETGNLVSTATHPAVITGSHLFGHNSTAYLSFGNGDIIPLNTETGQFYSEFSIHTSKAISYMLASVRKNALFILRNPSTGVFVLSALEGSDLETFIELPTQSYYRIASPDGEYFVFEGNEKYYYFDHEGKQCFEHEKEITSETPKNRCFWNNCLVEAYTNNLLICNPAEGDAKWISLEDLGIEETVQMVSINAATSTVAILNNSHTAYIIDLNELKITNSFTVDGSILKILLSPDGKTLVALTFEDILLFFDTNSGTEINLPTTLTVMDRISFSHDSFKFSGDGKYLAFLGEHQEVIVLNTSDYSVVDKIPLPCSTNFFLEFIGEDDVLLLQGADYNVYCYDITKKELINSTGFATKISEVLQDSERDLTVIVANDCLYVLSNRDYGQLAYIPNGITYSSKLGSFLTVERQTIFKIPYKNYRELIAEAKKQFPDAELSERKRMEYNID